MSDERGPSVLAMMALVAALPDLDRLRELLKRIQEMLTLGGVALALAVSCIFVIAWVLSYLRQPSASTGRSFLATLALLASYVPVGLTVCAALGAFVPMLAPYVLKSFALAIVAGTVVIVIAVLTALGTEAKGVAFGKAKPATA